MYGVFFFFKQKTAYYMRISDWSSDVCSSDLVAAAHLHVDRRGRAEIEDLAGHVGGQEGEIDARKALRQDLAQLGDEIAGRLVILVERDQDEIGRASCRERECEYV